MNERERESEREREAEDLGSRLGQSDENSDLERFEFLLSTG